MKDLDADTVEKINTLADTLKRTGLAASMTLAVEKAKEIVLGKRKLKKIEKIEEEMEEVQVDLRTTKDTVSDMVKKTKDYMEGNVPTAEDLVNEAIESEQKPEQSKVEQFLCVKLIHS